MTILICGSFAYDSIMLFPGRFKEHILPEQVHILNVSFLVPSLRREFGGCAGNIAYNLALLDGSPLPMATVGDDSQPYLEHLDRFKIDRRFVRQVPGTLTAQAFITTDLDDNQITAFHPGAMSHSHLNRIDPAGVQLGILGPDGRDGMLQHAEQMNQTGIPFIFDPGQGLPMFEAAELQWFVERAHYLALNDYEAKLMAAKTGSDMESLARRLKSVVVTLGAQGSRIHVNGRVLEIPVAPARAVRDPTGCGDAYRAGLLFGLVHGLDWPTTGRLAAVNGCTQDRAGRRPAAHGHTGADRGAFPGGLRVSTLVIDPSAAVCGRLLQACPVQDQQQYLHQHQERDRRQVEAADQRQRAPKRREQRARQQVEGWGQRRMRIDQAEQHVDKDQHRQHVQRPVQEQAEHLGQQQRPVQRHRNPGQPHQQHERQRHRQRCHHARPVDPGSARKQHAKRLDQPFRQGPGELNQRIVAGDPQPGKVHPEQQRAPEQCRSGVQQQVDDFQQQHRGFGQEGRRRL